MSGGRGGGREVLDLGVGVTPIGGFAGGMDGEVYAVATTVSSV